MKRKLMTVAEIKAILSQYNIGYYKDKHHIDITIENQNFKLITTKGIFLLKVFSSADEHSLKSQNNLLEYLYKEKVKVPKTIRNREGGDLTKFKDKYLSIYEFADGTHLNHLSIGICKNLALEIARMHMALLSYRPSDIGKKMYSYSRPDLEILQRRNLRQCVIHGDLGGSNILVKNNKVIAIIDFGDARWDFLVKDLAVLTASLVHKNNLKYIPIFYKEYQRFVELLPAEVDSIDFLILGHIHGVLEWLKRVSHEKQPKARLAHVKKAIIEFTKMLETFSANPVTKLIK